MHLPVMLELKMLSNVLSKSGWKSMPSSTGLDWSISNMKINLWYCKDMKQWRWVLTDDSRPIVKQESGQRPFLRDAMNDVANTVEYMLECKQPE
jgi:hypothetical protein